MLIVHHLNNSRSQRILWALEELAVPYEVKRYERDKETSLAPPSLKVIHPLGKSPLITDGESTIAESGAIIEYLLERYPETKLKPDIGTEAYRQYIYWLHFAEGSLMPGLLLKLVFETIVNSPMPFFARLIAKRIVKQVMESFVLPGIETNMNFVEQHLRQNHWFAGDKLTGADFQMSFPLEASVARGLDCEKYPYICAYVERIHDRPAYQKALITGGTYDYA